MKRKFLPAEARASLLATGKATVRTLVEQAYDHGDVAYAVCPASESGWIAWFGQPSRNTEEFTKKAYRHGFPCPTPEGAEYWVPEPWCPMFAYHRAYTSPAWAYMADTPAGSEGDSTRKAYGYVWRPAATMPKVAARLFVRVAAVRVVQSRVEKPLGEWQGEWYFETDLERITK